MCGKRVWCMKGTSEALPKVWEVPDGHRDQIHLAIVELGPPKSTGRKRVNPRRILYGIVFRVRTGFQKHRLPRELGGLVLEWQVLPFDRLRSAMGNGRLGVFSSAQPHGPCKDMQQM